MERQAQLKKRYQYLFLIQIIFLFIGTFYDLQISHQLFNRGSFYSEFFKVFGELPMTMLALAAAVSKIYFANGKAVFTYGLLAILFSLMIGFQIPFYLGLENLFLSLFLTVAIFLITAYFIKNMGSQYRGNLAKASSLILWAAFLSVLLINVIKIFWGRMRYFAMAELNDFSQFSAWYLPQAQASSDVFKSFPSGHSANATMMLLLNGLNQRRENDRKIFIFSSLWLILVQISRIVDGAHFLSDVAMGGIIALVIHCVLYRMRGERK